MASVVITARILHELVALLIYRIVRQMHAQVIQVASFRRYVVLSGKSGKTFPVYENSERHHGRDKDIDAQVEF